MQFSKNPISKYGASFKAQKVLLNNAKYSAFGPNLSCLPNCLDNNCNFPKSGKKYMAKNPHPKNQDYPLGRSWEKCVTDQQRDRWIDEQDWFYRTPFAKMEVWSCSSKIQEKTFLNYLAWLWAIWKEPMQEKGIQST